MTVADVPSGLEILFTPIRVRDRTLRNRLVAVPHGNSYGCDGIPAESHVAYTRRIAATTAGLIVVGASAIHETTYRPPLFSLFDDRALPRLREVVAAAHDAGALIVSQLGHSGRHAPLAGPDAALWAPSPLPPGANGERYAELDRDALGEVRSAYGSAARRALAAGFDGVEVHAAHGYLMQQFLSPYYNRRTDEYGGTLDGRMRLLVEVLERVRAVAAERIVAIRLGAGDDRGPSGLEWADVLEVARRIDRAGLVDYISLAVPAQKSRYVKDGSFPRGGLRPQSRELRASVRIPVIVSQRMDTPELAAEAIDSGDADLVALARELVADPDWGAKARSGATSLIRPCVLCLEGCRRTADAAVSGAVRCDVNPTAYGIEPDGVPPGTWGAGTVVVIGAGPAGCEAALAAARRGRRVVVFESAERAGGRARLAGRAPLRETWERYADWLEASLGAANIEVRRRTPATADAIRAIGPALVVVAVGATMARPGGADLSTEELLALPERPAWRSAVVLDPWGRWDAINAVERLAADGVRVRYLTSQERAAAQVPEESRDGALARLERAGVSISTGADLSRASFDVDVVVASGSLVPNDVAAGLAPARDVVRVGDCVSARGLGVATREGWTIGARLV